MSAHRKPSCQARTMNGMESVRKDRDLETASIRECELPMKDMFTRSTLWRQGVVCCPIIYADPLVIESCCRNSLASLGMLPTQSGRCPGNPRIHGHRLPRALYVHFHDTATNSSDLTIMAVHAFVRPYNSARDIYASQRIAAPR